MFSLSTFSLHYIHAIVSLIISTYVCHLQYFFGRFHVHSHISIIFPFNSTYVTCSHAVFLRVISTWFFAPIISQRYLHLYLPAFLPTVVFTYTSLTLLFALVVSIYTRKQKIEPSLFSITFFAQIN